VGLDFFGIYVVFCLLMRFITGTWKWFWVLAVYMITWSAAMFLDMRDSSSAIAGASGQWTGRFYSQVLFEPISSLAIVFGGGFMLVAALVWRIVKEIKRGISATREAKTE
jgi:hypothetical protein